MRRGAQRWKHRTGADPSAFAQRDVEVAASLLVTRLQTQRLAVFLDRALDVALLLEGHTEVVMRLGVVGVRDQRLSEVAGRPLEMRESASSASPLETSASPRL